MNTPKQYTDPSLFLPMYSVLAADRQHLLEKAGPINLWTEKGSQTGCIAVHFISADEISGLPQAHLEKFQAFLREMYGPNLGKLRAFDLLNAFFAWQGNMQLVDWKLSTYGVVALVNNYLDEAEWTEHMKYISKAKELVDADKEAEYTKREAEAAEHAKKEAAMKAEADKLLSLGKKALDHGWAERLEKQEAEIKKLRKELRDATGKR